MISKGKRKTPLQFLQTMNELKHILVIDKSKLFLPEIKEALQKLGMEYILFVCPKATHALEYLQMLSEKNEHRTDEEKECVHIFLNLKIPFSISYAFLDSIRIVRNSLRLKICLFTDLNCLPVEELERLKEYKVSHLHVKPLTPDLLQKELSGTPA